MAARSTGVLSGMKSLPVKVHLSSRAPVELNMHCLSTIQVSQWDNGIVAPVADVISMGRCYIQDTYSIQSIVFRKKYRTMERKKRSKGSVWEFCYAKKKFGKFEEEMKA